MDETNFSDGRKIVSIIIKAITISMSDTIMKFFGKSKTSSSNKDAKTILFVCVENAGRSQIAEGFFKKYAPSRFKTVSAGTKPAYQLNPIVVEAMKEVGIDISKQKSKELTDEMIRESYNVVNMVVWIKTFVLQYSYQRL